MSQISSQAKVYRAYLSFTVNITLLLLRYQKTV